MAENKFDDAVGTMLKGMNGFISARTVIGDPVKVSDATIIPLVDVSFGMGAGAFSGEKKDHSGGCVTGKIEPTAVLIVQNGTTRLVDIKNADTLSKLLDFAPTVVDRIVNAFSGKKDDAVDAAVDGIKKDAQDKKE
jgi:uncharacterized spore protein YtfJ